MSTGAGRTGFRVGLSLFVNADGTLGVFENGLRQNVLLLYKLFRAMPDCAEVRLLNAGDGALTEDPRPFGVDPAHVVPALDGFDGLDLVVSAGAALQPDALRRFRDRGGLSIAFKGGNGGVISMEAVVGHKTRTDGERYFDADLYDAVWLTPQHAATYRGWCEAVYRCPVRMAPHIWDPTFVRASGGPRFGYRPGRRPWRIGVMDPNITVMKTSHMPMLACEAAFRVRPEALEAVYVANAIQFAEHPHFTTFARSLSVVQTGRMTFEPRFVGAQFLADHCDAVVTHQWENGLNYLYWEALHGGYPLVHNSPFLAEVGYPYPDFDAEAGGEALLRAWAEHDDRLADYRDEAAARIATLDPLSAGVQADYRRLCEIAAGLTKDDRDRFQRPVDITTGSEMQTDQLAQSTS